MRVKWCTIFKSIMLCLASFQIGNVYAWCGITPAFASQLNIASLCIAGTFNERQIEMCEDEVDLDIDLQDIAIRGKQFQPLGLLFTQPLSPSDFLGYTGDMFNCYLGLAREVNYRYIINTRVYQERPLVSINGVQYYQTADGTTGNDIGLSIQPVPTSVFPPQNTDTAWVDIRPTTGSGGTVPSSKLSAMTVNVAKSDNAGLTQSRMSDAHYITLEMSYHPRYGNSRLTSYLRINMKFAPNKPIGRINTCAVSADRSEVSLGVFSPTQITENTNNDTPFNITYECDGPVAGPVWVGMQPTGSTTILQPYSPLLIRSAESTANGVGIAYSDRSGANFTPLAWLPSNVCSDVMSSFCASASPIGNGSDGWTRAKKAPNVNKATQTFYAKMQKISSQDTTLGGNITSGEVSAQVNVLVNHD